MFFITKDDYSIIFLTSNNYSALACVPKEGTFTCGNTQGINCSGWQLGLFGGIISLDSSDGSLCTPNNPQAIGNEGEECTPGQTSKFGGKKTRRKRKKQTRKKQTRKKQIRRKRKEQTRKCK